MKRRLHKPPSPKEQPNLYLVGFMGTGKSVIGKRIAKRFGMTFLDSDAEIERKYETTVHDIFAKMGEAKFREMEREFIEGGHPEKGCVISCGGGLVCSKGMPELLKKKGIVIVLFAEAEVILKRVSGNSKRPLLQVENPLERIKALMAERYPTYAKCGACVSTAGNINDAEERVAFLYLQKIKNRTR